jgi:hypothetical protein
MFSDGFTLLALPLYFSLPAASSLNLSLAFPLLNIPLQGKTEL